MKDMKAIITRAMVAFIVFIMIIIVYAFVGTSEDKGKIRKDEDRIVEYIKEKVELNDNEELRKIEFKSFKQNTSTRTWRSHAIINDDIHITYDINDLSGKSEIGMVFHIAESNGKRLKKKNNIENNGSTDTVEVHYWEG